MVPAAGFAPARPEGQRILSSRRLLFRHAGKNGGDVRARRPGAPVTLSREAVSFRSRVNPRRLVVDVPELASISSAAPRVGAILEEELRVKVSVLRPSFAELTRLSVELVPVFVGEVRHDGLLAAVLPKFRMLRTELRTRIERRAANVQAVGQPFDQERPVSLREDHEPGASVRLLVEVLRVETHERKGCLCAPLLLKPATGFKQHDSVSATDVEKNAEVVNGVSVGVGEQQDVSIRHAVYRVKDHERFEREPVDSASLWMFAVSFCLFPVSRAFVAQPDVVVDPDFFGSKLRTILNNPLSRLVVGFA
jgi:hypothetical protein